MMEPITRLTGPAIPLATPNVDTDVIIRIDRLAELARGELGPYAFEAIRFDADGNPRPENVFNDPRYALAPILIAGENFGCGSSREGAVWTIQERGIRCIIAPEFGGIFANNCFQNGVLTIVLPTETVNALREQCQPTGNAKFDVDLEAQTVTAPDGTAVTFEIDGLKRDGLLRG
ncbi:MAG: 3-isopropylmalate dehydratase small subunit, partial [Pseudomonadota bacterium]